MLFLLNVLVLICYAEGYRFDYDYSKEAEVWLKLHRVPATWKDAYLNCYYEGAVLASPENEKIWSAMKSSLQDNLPLSTCGVHTGVHATFGKGAYFSVEGIPLARMPIHWTADEPDNADNAEDCLVMLSNGSMADVNCSETFPYFCYIKKMKDLNRCGTVDDGQTLAAAGYDHWAGGQPDQFRGPQNCGAIFRNGLLDDNNCENMLPFICEKDPDSLLSEPTN